MKKVVAIILILATIALISIIALSDHTTSEQFVRIHIRANSTSTLDSDIKYTVKDKVVGYLTPIILNSKSKTDFDEKLSQNIANIVGITNSTLAQNNFDYTSNVVQKYQYFPLRDYDGITLNAGYYDEIGRAHV